jgi:hypothetical protein
MDSLRKPHEDLFGRIPATKSSEYVPASSMKPYSNLDCSSSFPMAAFSTSSPRPEGVGLEVDERASRNAAQFNGSPLFDAELQGSCLLPELGPESGLFSCPSSF